jgi:hypothetical protein
MHPRSVFIFADSSHQGPCICRGDWYGSSEIGSPRIPRPAILRTYMSYLHSTFIQTHSHSHTDASWWKLWNWASQLLLMIMENAFTYRGSWWCQSCRNDEMLKKNSYYQTGIRTPEHWNESRTLYPLHHQNPQRSNPNYEKFKKSLKKSPPNISPHSNLPLDFWGGEFWRDIRWTFF